MTKFLLGWPNFFWDDQFSSWMTKFLPGWPNATLVFMVAPELSRSSTPSVSLAWTSSMKRWVKLLSTNILMAKGIFLQKSLSNETIFTQMSYVWVECFCPIVIIAIVVVLRCTSSFGFGSCSWLLSLASPLSSGLLLSNLYITHNLFYLCVQSHPLLMQTVNTNSFRIVPVCVPSVRKWGAYNMATIIDKFDFKFANRVTISFF